MIIYIYIYKFEGFHPASAWRVRVRRPAGPDWVQREENSDQNRERNCPEGGGQCVRYKLLVAATIFADCHTEKTSEFDSNHIHSHHHPQCHRSHVQLLQGVFLWRSDGSQRDGDAGADHDVSQGIIDRNWLELYLNFFILVWAPTSPQPLTSRWSTAGSFSIFSNPSWT